MLGALVLDRCKGQRHQLAAHQPVQCVPIHMLFGSVLSRQLQWQGQSVDQLCPFFGMDSGKVLGAECFPDRCRHAVFALAHVVHGRSFGQIEDHQDHCQHMRATSAIKHRLLHKAAHGLLALLLHGQRMAGLQCGMHSLEAVGCSRDSRRHQ
ncbi:hypothetical protein SDC9_185088 [bioreactor metagenome]|uniref:Uncharacterized protein n=1 Tax=bioreactor metagenome TaxID=1076179 RepID=A0A645HEV1_9ZZZZ